MARTRLVLWPSEGQSIGNHKRDQFGVVPAKNGTTQNGVAVRCAAGRNLTANRVTDETSGNKEVMRS